MQSRAHNTVRRSSTFVTAKWIHVSNLHCARPPTYFFYYIYPCMQDKHLNIVFNDFFSGFSGTIFFTAWQQKKSILDDMFCWNYLFYMISLFLHIIPNYKFWCRWGELLVCAQLLGWWNKEGMMIHDMQSFGKSGCFIHNTISSNNNGVECIMQYMESTAAASTQSWCLMQISHPYIYDERAQLESVGWLAARLILWVCVFILYYYFRPLALTGRRRKFNSQRRQN